jgi:anti-sigma regulatory factor (Ser/Thr protein kinase)
VGAVGDSSRDVAPAAEPVRLEVRGGPSALRPAADRVVAAFAVGVAAPRRAELVLAVHELLANALEHGHLGDPALPVVVEVVRDEAGAATVRVVDRARGGRWSPAVTPPRLAARGRGLELVRAVGDGLRVLSGSDRTVVELTVR